jgi:hypothetical protein
MSVRRLLFATALLTAGLPMAAAPAAAAPNGGDFGVTMTGPVKVTVLDEFSYQVDVKNFGPGRADAVVSGQVPAGFAVRGASPTHGTCAVAGETFRCDLTRVAPGSRATVYVKVRAVQRGQWTVTASLSTDADAANNTTSVVTEVEHQRLTPPYDEAYASGHGRADVVTGAVSVVVPSGCITSCSGLALVDERVVLSGSGNRTVDVAVVLRLSDFNVQPGDRAVADVVLFAEGREAHVCAHDLSTAYDLEPAYRFVYTDYPAESDEDVVVLTCSLPDPVAANGTRERRFTARTT